MSKAENPSGADEGDAKLSWREREMVAALKRLANAQLQVAQIDAQIADTSGAGRAAEIDPADAAALDETVAELAKLSKKSQSRFGGGAARERVNELESKQRLILDRMGFDSHDAYVSAKAEQGAAGPTATAGVDPVVEGFARRELAAAEATYRDLLLLPDDADPDEVDAGESDGDDDSGDDGSSPTIDLTG